MCNDYFFIFYSPFFLCDLVLATIDSVAALTALVVSVETFIAAAAFSLAT